MWNNKDIVRFLCFAEAPWPRAPVACAAVEGSLTAHYESLTKANSCTFPSRLRLTSGRTSHTVERNSYSSDVFETHRSTSQATAKKKEVLLILKLIIIVGPYRCLNPSITSISFQFQG